MTTEPNYDLLDIFLEALESGSYRQAVGAMRDGDCFCAAGLACEVFRQKTGEGDWIIIDEDAPQIQVFAFNDSTYITGVPEQLQDQLLPQGIADPFGERSSLMELNDGLRLPFADIASLLRQQYHRPKKEGGSK